MYYFQNISNKILTKVIQPRYALLVIRISKYVLKSDNLVNALYRYVYYIKKNH